MITSPSNEKIKHARTLLQKKGRDAAGQFLLEGTRLIQEAARAGLVPAFVFYERAAFDSDARVRALIVSFQKQTREVYKVNAAVMRALSDTETPQGIAAVFSPPHLPPPPCADIDAHSRPHPRPGQFGHNAAYGMVRECEFGSACA